VATPIGNLADITLRALHVLHMVDAIACEDTRHTRSLLRAYGLEKSSAALMALHQHNESAAAQHVMERLTRGERVAYVSDAGTPGISDPGARLVAAVRATGLRCMPLPGASSITCALSVAGVVGEEGGFWFAGFLPAKGSARAAAVAALQREPRCTVLLEAPHRMVQLAAELDDLGARHVTIARELTKQFEHITTCRADALSAWLAADAQHRRGEFVVVLHPQPIAALDDTENTRILRLLLAELPLKTAVRLAADITQQSKNTLYQQALLLKEAHA